MRGLRIGISCLVGVALLAVWLTQVFGQGEVFNAPRVELYGAGSSDGEQTPAVASSSLPEAALEEIKANFLDEEGFIVQKNGDGGDSLNRLGHLYSLLYFLGYAEDLQGMPLPQGFRAQLAKLTAAPGLYRRHWDQNEWYFNENTTSRDQYTPIIIAAGLLGENQILADISAYLKEHSSRYPNTIPNGNPPGAPKNPDILLPGNAGEFLRGGGNISGLQPFDQYSVADLDCAQVYMARFRTMQQVGPKPLDSGSDDLNTTLTLLYGLTKNPSNNLQAAAYEYFNAAQKPIDRLRYYFRPSSNAPPLADVYEAAIRQVLEAHPLQAVVEANDCKTKVSAMMRVVADRAWKKVPICKGEFYRTFRQDVTGLNFDFTKDNFSLDLEVSQTCKNSPNAIIKTEVKAQGKVHVEANPITCEVKTAKATLNGTLLNFISIPQLEKDLTKEAQKELLKVCTPNAPPTANAGPDQPLIRAGEAVILSAAQSSDPDHDITSYRWEQVGGAPLVVLENEDTVEALFTAPKVAQEAADLLFQVTVTDRGGLDDTDTCVVHIEAQKNQPPVAEAGNDRQVKAGTRVILNGSRSSDPDGIGDITSYLWKQLTGPPVILNKSKAKSTFFRAPPTNELLSLSFELQAKDSTGQVDTDTCTIKVKPDTALAVTVPNGGQNWKEGTQRVIQWDYSEEPGTVTLSLLKGTQRVKEIIKDCPVGTGGKGSFSWLIPTDLAPGANYKIQISGSSGCAACKDASDKTFKISKRRTGL